MGTNNINNLPSVSLQALMTSLQSCTVILDNNGNIICSNKKAWALFDCFSEEEFIEYCQKNLVNVVIVEDKKRITEKLSNAFSLKGFYETICIHTKFNNIRKIDIQGASIGISGLENAIICTLTINNDGKSLIFENEKFLSIATQEENFISLAHHKVVSGLDYEEISQFYLVFFHIKNFKYYVEDNVKTKWYKVLRNLAIDIRKNINNDEIIGQFNNTDLVCLVSNKQYAEIINNVIANFDAKHEEDDLFLHVGVYPINDSNILIVDACNKAKFASEQNNPKESGYFEYDGKLEKNIDIESFILKNFDNAIENNYIQVYYQPVVRTINGQLCGYEALARWIDPEAGFLSPAEFIPVLEKHKLITKLDLHILKRVCIEMNETEQREQTVMPVSFNLSRIDFLACDIFAEVDKIVLAHDVPRDMINIEITESIVMKDPKKLEEAISKFRENGYQVWMDDFGSGYSSLNVLKDFHLDEIKLDMAFLSTFDERSQKIIKSIIAMAKDIGIMTLAEGVETKEQYEFLRDIGCEKAQGYYFSKPQPLLAVQKFVVDKNIWPEKRSWREFYDNIGRVNFLTESSLSIFEYDGKKFNYIYSNNKFYDVWYSIIADSEDKDDLLDFTKPIRPDSVAYPIRTRVKDVITSISESSNKVQIVCPILGKYIKLDFHYLAKHHGRIAFSMGITNLSENEEKNKRERIDNVFRMMSSAFDSIFALDLNTDKVEVIIQGFYGSITNLQNVIAREDLDFHFINEFIHPEDQKEYIAFIARDGLIERLKASEHCVESQFFRTKNLNGSFVWKAHSLQYIAESNYVVYSICGAPNFNENLIKKLTPNYMYDENGQQYKGYYASLIRSIKESKNINIFWKDKNRRFVGVNQKFLESYGLHDDSSLIGKTDEEMKWHIDDGPFKNDEINVIENGVVIANRIGNCNIKGVSQKIIVFKEPLYDKGEIVGLVGYFFVLNDLGKEFGWSQNLNGIDQVTNLLSAHGMTNVLAEYIEGWHIRKENFAVIRIFLKDYNRLLKYYYGEDVARNVLKEYGELLASIIGLRGSCARLYSGTFVMILKCNDKSEAQVLAQQIVQTSNSIHSLYNSNVTLNPTIKIEFADEVGDINSMLVSIEGTAISNAEKQLLQDKLNYYNLQMDTIVDAIPGGIVLHEILEKGSKVIYVSEGAARITGRTVEEFNYVMNTDKHMGIIPQDASIVMKAVCDTIEKGEELDVSYRIYHKNGSIVWTNMKGRIIGEQNGNPLLLTVFYNITETSKIYQSTLDEAFVSVIIRSEDNDEILYLNDSAKNLATETLNLSYDEFRKVIINEKSKLSKNEILISNENGNQFEQYEITYKGITLFIRNMRTIWNGRNCLITYFMDVSLKYREQNLAKDILSNISAATAVFYIDKNYKLTINFVNEIAKKYLGLGDIKQGDFEILFFNMHPDDIDYVRGIIEDLITNKKPVNGTYRIISSDQNVTWLRFYIKPILQPDGTCLFYATYFDVTEQKLREEKAREFNEQQMHLFKSAIYAFEHIGNGEFFAKILLDYDTNKIVDNWYNSEKYKMDMSLPASKFMETIEIEAFNDEEREKLKNVINLADIAEETRNLGFSLRSFDYIRRELSGIAYSTRIEVKSILDPETAHVMIYVFGYNLNQNKIPFKFIEDVMINDLESVLLINEDLNVVQAYNAKNSSDIIISTCDQHLELCEEFAKVHLDPEDISKFLILMNLDNVKLQLSTKQLYRFSFNTINPITKETKRMVWLYAYAGKSHKDIVMCLLNDDYRS